MMLGASGCDPSVYRFAPITESHVKRRERRVRRAITESHVKRRERREGRAGKRPRRAST